MKKILAFLALASLAQVSFAQVSFDAGAVNVTSGVVVSATGTAGAAATCVILSANEPPVTLNLSRDVVAAMACDAGANAAGAGTQHPGGRPAGCSGGRCGYVATTAGGPVTAVNGAAEISSANTPAAFLITCTDYIAAHTSGAVSAACQ